MSPRAAPLTPEERRQALVEATLPLLHEHGRTVTTKQIAQAAGVAEGTIFRVFDSKDDLVQAAVEHGLDMGPFLADLAAIDHGQDLRSVVGDVVAVLQERFRSVFALMTRMGMIGPPKSHRHTEDARRAAREAVVGLLAPHAAELTCPPEHLGRAIHLVTFAGTHPHLSEGQPLTTAEIVTLVLDGLEKKKDHR